MTLLNKCLNAPITAIIVLADHYNHMKIINKASIAVLALASTVLGIQAQEFNAREHPMIVSLVFSSEGALTSNERVSGPVTVTNYQQNVLVERVGNRQFLEYLLEIGVIQSISGWSLVFVSSTEGEGYEVGTYISRRGGSLINVSGYLDIQSQNGIEAVRGQIVENDDTGAYLETGSGVGVAIGNLYIEDEWAASGILRTRFGYFFRENGINETDDELLGGVIASITGYIGDDDDSDDDEELSLIEGTVRFSAGRRIFLSNDG
jgi:hypothetical protein